MLNSPSWILPENPLRTTYPQMVTCAAAYKARPVTREMIAGSNLPAACVAAALFPLVSHSALHRPVDKAPPALLSLPCVQRMPDTPSRSFDQTPSAKFTTSHLTRPTFMLCDSYGAPCGSGRGPQHSQACRHPPALEDATMPDEARSSGYDLSAVLWLIVSLRH